MSNFTKGFKDWFFGRLPEGKFSVGGQAVMEGVMMQGPGSTAIAVRKGDGTIAYKTKKAVRLKDKYPVLGWPIIRGIVSFIMSLYSGMKTLMESADMAGLDAEEPSRFEKKLAEILHKEPNDIMMYAAVILAVILSVGLFYLIPVGIESVLKGYVGLKSEVALKLIGGIVRMAIFLGYVMLCARIPDIRRVFQYHGAEHKSIFCFENGEELTVDNARKYTTLHPRCGTSFLVIVMLISILVFLLMGNKSSNLFLRFGSQLSLLPLVAGVSYEILQGLGRARDNALVRALKWPGLMVQKITTAEPDDSMLEVALVSLKASLGYAKEDILPAKERPAPVEEPRFERQMDLDQVEDDLT